MRNLALLRRQCERLELVDGKFVGAAIDGDNGRAFFVSDRGSLHWISLVDQSQGFMRISESTELQPVAGLDYLMESEAVIVAFENGDLVLAEPASGNVEVIGSLKGGIRSMTASPDGSLVALATGAGMLLVMTLDWDLLYEFPFAQPNRNGEAERTVSPGGVEIAWRPDAKYFSTNERNPADGTSLIKIWNREGGMLHSSCSLLPSSRTATSWYFSGARIAAGCSKTQEAPVVLVFERNGLEKDRFEITAPADAVLDAVQWNSNGELLSVLLRCAEWDLIQFWSCSNYHWYLKQEWRYAKSDVVRTTWHSERPFCCIVWTALGRVEVAQMGWKPAVLGSSTAFVIDGPNVLVTPLAMSLVPPPMYHCKLSFTAAVNAVAASQDCSMVVASLSDGKVSLLLIPDLAHLEGVECQGLVLQNFTGCFRELVLKGTGCLCGVVTSSEGEQLVELLISSDSAGVMVTSEKKVSKRVVSLVGNSSEVFIQLGDGSIVTSSLATVAKFRHPCPWLELVEKSQVFVGLDENDRLHVGDVVISEDCSSFTVHRTSIKSSNDAFHLIYTTKQDVLHVVSLDKDLTVSATETLNVPQANGSIPGRKSAPENDFNVRKVWERGARLVCSLSGSDVGVILQTKRGNLETVYPRGLILQTISSALADRNFGEAMLCARRHRIDLNVIVDFLGEEEFSKQASEFVKQIGSLSLATVTELVCSLRKENVLKATYAKTLSCLSSTMDLSEAGSDKMEVVLQALRIALEKEIPDSPSRELCLLTILARNDPPLLEEALKRIKKVREAELSLESKLKNADGKLTSEAALKHLIWLVDADAVFNSALGLYDLHLAAMVASHSQRDPKEFLPFLKELEDMAPPLMRYQIDLKLHRYESALRNLASAGDDHYSQCLELIKQYPELYPVGLDIFTEQSRRFSILEQWGDHLLAEEKFEEAGLSFCACSRLEKALAAYRAGGLWQSVLVVAGQLNMPVNELNKLASELRDDLQAMGKPREAARIALDYSKDIEGAVGHLIDARDWVEVLRWCYLYSRADLVESLVKTSAEECAAAMVVQFEEGLEKLGKYVARFTAVQQRRLALEAKLKSELADRNGVEDDQETVSEASTSNLSGMSVYTRGSSKTNATGKSKARRQGRIRAGSPGEELALVEHLRGMENSTQLEEEVRPLLKVLVLTGQEKLACKLQQRASKFEAAQIEAVRQVEAREALPSQQGAWSYQTLNFSPK